MEDKIIAKYRELKEIVVDFVKKDDADSEKFIEAIKAKIKEFSELVEGSEENKED